MAKKRSIGTTIFALLFLLLSFYLGMYPWAILMSYLHNPRESISNIIYGEGYKARIRLIEKERIIAKADLIKLGKEPEFNQKFEAFKNEAERFRRKYIVQGNLLPHEQLGLFFGFLACILNFIAAAGLLLHFRWARRIVFGSVVATVLSYFSFLYLPYWTIIFTQKMSATTIALENMLMNQCPGPSIFSTWGAFNAVFLSPISWKMHLLVIIYVVVVCYYFTRPKVKDQLR